MGLDSGLFCEDTGKVITLFGWMETCNLCQLLTGKTQRTCCTLNLKQNLCTGRRKANTQGYRCSSCFMHFLTACCFLQRLWYCQAWDVYLSLEWSQAARRSLKKLVKFKANKFTHHCQFPSHYLVLFLFFFVFVFLTYNYVRAYPRAPLTLPLLPL